MTDPSKMSDLIERSSLGTTGARSLRQRTAPGVALNILARAADHDRAAADVMDVESTGVLAGKALMPQRVVEGDQRTSAVRVPDAEPAYAWHRSGPWVVVYGCGPDSEDVGHEVHKQCISRGVDSLLHPIDEINQVRLDRFTGLVVVLPSQLANPSSVLRPFTRLIMDYRARRPEGLESILNGSCEWFEAGVVQVVGRPAIMRHPEMRAALDHACARHDTGASGVLDVFQPYMRKLVLAQQLDEPLVADEVRDHDIGRLWRDVQAWGVTDIHDVPKLRKCIDDYREHYENSRFSRLYRPIGDIPRNRLDIILDGPQDVVIGDRKTWMESGARVCREVIKGLHKIVPELTRPSKSNNTKDAQKQLRMLYRKLRTIDGYLHVLDK